MRKYRYRWLTVLLCALCCAMFLVQIGVGLWRHDSLSRILFAPTDVVLLLCGAAYTGMPMPENWYRLVTSMFEHGGLIHLAANVIALWQLGALLEELFGVLPVAASFAIGGLVAGGLSVSGPGSGEKVLYVGASGAIFAIAGTLLVGLRRVSKLDGGQWSRQLTSRLLGCLGFNLVLGLGVSGFAAWAGLGFAIAVGAHVAGLVTGALIGLALRMKLADTPLTRRVMPLSLPVPSD